MNYRELMIAMRRMSYRNLQTALKKLKESGLTTIKLNVKRVILENEYERLMFKEIIKEQEQKEKTFTYQVEKFAKVAEISKKQVIEFCKEGDDMGSNVKQLAVSQGVSYNDMVDKINEIYRIFCLPKDLNDNEFTLLNFIANKLYLSEEEALKELQAIA